MMEDLFSYKGSPGHQGGSTSKAAADSMKPSAGHLARLALETLKRAGPLTPDEIAKRLDLSVLAIRPRITELKQSGKIEDTGERRENDSGRKAKVWRAR